MPTQARGRESRTRLLRRAVQISSRLGLRGTTIGLLAKETGLSKGGVAGLFQDKESLDLAIVDHAAQTFLREVVASARVDVERDPVGSLERLGRAWIRYAEEGIFEGGCFFLNVSAEVDDLGSAVTDRVRDYMHRWLSLIESVLRAGVRARVLRGDLDAGAEARRFVAILHEGMWAYKLFSDPRELRTAERMLVDFRRSLLAPETPVGLAALAV